MSDSFIKVCLVSPLPPPLGGIGRWSMLLRQWAANNPQISIAQVDIAPRWRAIDDIANWTRVIGGGLQLLRDYGRFIAAVRGADVIHLTTSGQLGVVRDLAICATAKLFKIPVVYHLHFGRVPHIAFANTCEWRLLLRIMKLANVILPLDETTASVLREHLPSKLVEITPNPINPANFPPPSLQRTGKKTLLFMGWIIPSKGVEELLAAWNSLTHNAWELVIAGPGALSYQNDLVGRFMPQDVHFAGEIPHDLALQLMADCDLFVLPSHTEAFPFVVLEAMALSKAIIATDVGAISEMFGENCGILVQSKDVKNLGAALKLLMDDDILRGQLGHRARERALANYTVDAVFNRLLTIWRRAGEK